MFKRIFINLSIIKLLTILFICFSSSLVHAKTLVIGIIEPLEHRAMDEIVAGFKETIKSNSSQEVKFEVQNAQGDMNLQRAIIQKMKAEHYDMIAPIGVSTTEMSLALIKNKPIISLASDFTETNRKNLKSCNIVAVHDEISSKQTIEFAKKVYPNLKNILLVHSSSDKVIPEVAEIKQVAKNYSINMKAAMVNNLSELYVTANQSISPDTQMILVLKDSLIVSGIATLAKISKDKKIPLMTSDQGSVEDGANFAIGVHEKQIGVEGGILAAKVINGSDICKLPMVDMTKLTVFINPISLKNSNQDINLIKNAAVKMSYNIEEVKF